MNDDSKNEKTEINDIFVCDFEAVDALYDSITEDITALDEDINSKKTTTINMLSTNWMGKASTAFTNSLDAQHSKIDTNIENARSMIKFIKSASDQIQQLETELTSYEI